MDFTNFEVGEQFPLPITAVGDGGLFQIDSNGITFILQLSRADIIAVEAFRTGKMELALFEDDGLLFFLYQIDGIFKDDWGDASLTLHTLKEENLPNLEKLTDKTLHLYLVDPRLNILLAMRRVSLTDEFFDILYKHTKNQLENPFDANDYLARRGKIWQEKSSAEMRKLAICSIEVPLEITNAPSH